jgi:hypothetical protein
MTDRRGLQPKEWRAIAEGLLCSIQVIDNKNMENKISNYNSHASISQEPLTIYLTHAEACIVYTRKQTKAYAEGTPQATRLDETVKQQLAKPNYEKMAKEQAAQHKRELQQVEEDLKGQLRTKDVELEQTIERCKDIEQQLEGYQAFLLKMHQNTNALLDTIQVLVDRGKLTSMTDLETTFRNIQQSLSGCPPTLQDSPIIKSMLEKVVALSNPSRLQSLCISPSPIVHEPVPSPGR